MIVYKNVHSKKFANSTDHPRNQWQHLKHHTPVTYANTWRNSEALKCYPNWWILCWNRYRHWASTSLESYLFQIKVTSDIGVIRFDKKQHLRTMVLYQPSPGCKIQHLGASSDTGTTAGSWSAQFRLTVAAYQTQWLQTIYIGMLPLPFNSRHQNIHIIRVNISWENTENTRHIWIFLEQPIILGRYQV